MRLKRTPIKGTIARPSLQGRANRRARRAPVVVMSFVRVPIPDADAVGRIASTIVGERRRGLNVLAVVPPYERTSEELDRLARAVTASASPREHALLVSSGASMSTALCAMGVHRLGHGAVSLEGAHAGILTDDDHASAKLVEIRPERMAEELRRHGTVLVSSTVGVARETEETTLLASGGVDIALELAAALRAARCDIVSAISDGAGAAANRFGETMRRIPISARTIAFAQDHAVRLQIRSLATTPAEAPG